MNATFFAESPMTLFTPENFYVASQQLIEKMPPANIARAREIVGRYHFTSNFIELADLAEKLGNELMTLL